ncbi:MAG: hypothetical protein WBD63_11515 [Phycisphaerae bacterium]|nr:hypothetical protein [Phycisphaerae bacterium]
MSEKPQPTSGGEATPAVQKPARQRQPISPGGLVAVAAFIAMAYGVGHVLGWREYVSSVFATSAGSSSHIIMGLLYAIAYFGFVLVAPLLVLAAALFAILSRIFARTR